MACADSHSRSGEVRKGGDWEARARAGILGGGEIGAHWTGAGGFGPTRDGYEAAPRGARWGVAAAAAIGRML